MSTHYQDSFSAYMNGPQNFGQLPIVPTSAPAFSQEGVNQFGAAADMASGADLTGMAGAGGNDWLSNIFGNFLSKKDPITGITDQGWGGMALSAAQGIGSAYMGMKQYGLAKDSFDEGKRRYNQDYAAQKTLTNGSLEDRQRARVASNGSAYQSVGDYMQKNGVV